MTNPLVPFVLTLAAAWGSLAAAGAKYVFAVQEAERARAASVPPDPPAKPPDPPTPSPPAKKDEPVADVTPQPSATRPTPVTTPMPMPAPVVVTPKPPATRLPDGVDWRAGDLLVLVAPSADLNRVGGEFAGQIAAVENRAGPRLIGGGVLVSGRSRVWRWRDWDRAGRTHPDEAAGAESVSDGFARALANVAGDRQTVADRRAGAAFRTAVVWHSAYEPADLPAGVGPIPAAVLVWTGAEQQVQRANTALPRAFGGRAGVFPLGPQVHDVAAAVAGLPRAR